MHGRQTGRSSVPCEHSSSICKWRCTSLISYLVLGRSPHLGRHTCMCRVCHIPWCCCKFISTAGATQSAQHVPRMAWPVVCSSVDSCRSFQNGGKGAYHDKPRCGKRAAVHVQDPDRPDHRRFARSDLAGLERWRPSQSGMRAAGGRHRIYGQRLYADIKPASISGRPKRFSRLQSCNPTPKINSQPILSDTGNPAGFPCPRPALPTDPAH